MGTALPQQRVAFYGDELLGVQDADGTVYAPFSRLCENLGLERRGQVQRVQRHAVLRDALITLTVETPGGAQDVQCLRADALPLWLAGIQASRVKDDLRDKLIHYQREAAHVLWRAFKPRIIQETGSTPYADEAASLELQQIADMGRAITRMAEQQMDLQRQHQAMTSRIDTAAYVIKGVQGVVADVQIRLDVLEERIHPAAYITETQATEVSNQVKALAELLTSQDTKKNQYHGIFSELYRRFGVPSYKHIRHEQYGDVLAFLDDWRTAAQKGEKRESGNL